MSNPTLQKSYRIVTTGGVPARRVVVVSAAAGDCALPAGANAAGVLGLTAASQPAAYRAVTVVKSGLAEAEAAGPVAIGAAVHAADALGRVRAVEADAGAVVHVVGFAETAAAAAGDIVTVNVAPHLWTTPVV